jgi:hypothetical protein
MMIMSPEQIEIALERILPRVSKPGRYTGGELNQVVKEWNDVGYKVASPSLSPTSTTSACPTWG